MNKQLDWIHSTQQLRELLHENFSPARTPTNTDRRFKFAVQHYRRGDYWCIWNTVSKNIIATIKVLGNGSLAIRYRPNSHYAHIFVNRNWGRSAKVVPSDNLGRHSNTIRDAIDPQSERTYQEYRNNLELENAQEDAQLEENSDVMNQFVSWYYDTAPAPDIRGMRIAPNSYFAQEYSRSSDREYGEVDLDDGVAEHGETVDVPSVADFEGYEYQPEAEISSAGTNRVRIASNTRGFGHSESVSREMRRHLIESEIERLNSRYNVARINRRDELARRIIVQRQQLEQELNNYERRA